MKAIPFVLAACGGALAGVILWAGGTWLAGTPAKNVPQVASSKSLVVDRAAIAPAPRTAPAEDHFVIKRVLPISGPIKYGEWHWDEAGAPAGPIVITVDLDARVLSVFRGGYEIGATAVLLGTQEKPTPLGVFPIMGKAVDHVSNIYDAPMPYMQRLTNDGITIHATSVQNGYASHGCVGTPLAFAKRLYGVTKTGDKVYITRGKTIGVGDSLASS